MSNTKATRTVAVTNPEGIHARAAIAIAALVRRFDATVVLIKDIEPVKGTDVLQILSLGAGLGERLLLEASGPQAKEALDALVQLFAGNFSEAEQTMP